MALPEQQINQRPCDVAGAPRRSLSLRGAALFLAVGLLLGGLLASGSPHGNLPQPTDGPFPQSALRSLIGATDEEKLLFSTTSVEPSRPADLLPVGMPVVYAFYKVPGASANVVPKGHWSKNGVKQGQIPTASITIGKRAGEGTVVLRAPGGGFGPGVYEVELEVGTNKVTGSFVTAVGAEAILGQPAPKDAEAAITKAAFADGVDAHGQPQRVRKTFYGTERIYFVFRFAQAEPGSTVKVAWLGGGQAIDAAEREVLLPSEEGWAHAWLQAPFPGLPPGEYRATVTMSGDTRPIATADFTVAQGSAPLPPAVR